MLIWSGLLLAGAFIDKINFDRRDFYKIDLFRKPDLAKSFFLKSKILAYLFPLDLCL